MKFIEVTSDKTKRKTLVNIDHILTIESCNNMSVLYISGTKVFVKENYDKVKEMIEYACNS